jgi:cell division protein FtsB
MRRSVARVVGALVVPSICAATIAYFGYFTIWGERGLMALAATQAQLATQREQLDTVREARERLQHRIQLLRSGHADADLVQEIRRNQLMGAEAGEIAIPRKTH